MHGQCACPLFAGPDDIPKKGSCDVFGQVLFAKDKVEYHGQPLGLIVAESQVPKSPSSVLFKPVFKLVLHLALRFGLGLGRSRAQGGRGGGSP